MSFDYQDNGHNISKEILRKNCSLAYYCIKIALIFFQNSSYFIKEKYK